MLAGMSPGRQSLRRSQSGRVSSGSPFLRPLALLIRHCLAGGGGGYEFSVGEADGAHEANVAAASGDVFMQCAGTLRRAILERFPPRAERRAWL
jgi:hypothetical protein